jgi:hypothetical protein
VNQQGGWWTAPVLGAAIAFVITTSAVEAAAAAPATILLLMPTGSRLAAELKRELEISSFAVRAMPMPATARDWRDWKGRARNLLTADQPRAVALRADERQVIVFSRAATSGVVEETLDLHLDPGDRLARRRACLTAIEFLRVSADADSRESVARTPSAPAEAEQAEDAGEPSRVVPPGDDQPETAMTTRSGEEPLTRGLPWSMGVGTMLDVSSTKRQPSGHLQFMWYFPLTPRLVLRARAQWPILGVDFQSGGADVRMWTFGAAVGVQYSFTESPTRWRPFVGAALGNRMALTETSSGNPIQSRTAVTPTVNLSLEGGLRYAIGPRVQIFSEVELARDWLVSSTNRADYELAIANAFSIHLSGGVLFEY